MIFERQRLLLSLLDALNGSIGNTDFQKLLLLYTRECEKTPSYDFVPYKFGAFSFTSYADKRRLIETGLLEKDDQFWRLTDAGRKVSKSGSIELTMTDFCKRYKSMRGNVLIAETYRRYPYYATRSEIIEKVLSDVNDRKRVSQALTTPSSSALLTIGYEGKSLEGYLNQLLKVGVTVLCDVRRNPLSRKYGFSKNTLSNACKGVGIQYEHLPQLGIASDQRQDLNEQKDYDALFEVYEQECLPHQTKVLELIRNWVIKEKRRVALTCFELSSQQCHRGRVANALEDLFGSELSPIHL